MSTCKGCGKKGFRKGTIVTLFGPGQRPTGAKVCGECAAGGMLVVARKVAAPVVQKVARPDGYDKALRMLRTYAGAARASAKASPVGEDSHFNSKAEGIEVAIQVVRREIGGEAC